MDNVRILSCVTGASGMVGRRIVQRLLSEGYQVRVLSRREQYDDPNVEHFRGCLKDAAVLKRFLQDAKMLFHCAAELNDESKMWDVNVLGTEQVLSAAAEAQVEYFCYLSSAGVVGRVSRGWVNEKSPCDPQNSYEKSKWAAEQIVAKGVEGARVVILRPINVVDEDRLGAFLLPVRGSVLDMLKMFVKGGECAHAIHAEDVAAAALYLFTYPAHTPEVFFVSCDHEPLNTFAGIWSLYKVCRNGKELEGIRPVPHLPVAVPHLMRRLWRGSGNYGDVRYSSEKLSAVGFVPPLGFKGTVRRIVSTHASR